MRRYILLSIAAVMCLALLAGCVKVEEKVDVKMDVGSFSKAQKIAVYDAAGNEKAVLTEKADIDAFVDGMCVDGWKFSELPEGLTDAGHFTLWQEETVTALLGEREAKLNEICTFRFYQEEDYLVVETGWIDITFAVSQETADYLRGVAA